MATEDGMAWQAMARREADRLEAAMLADQSLEEQRDALVASFYEDHPEPVDIEAEFRSLVASFEADHGDELAQHKARYVVAEAPQHHGRGTLVASYVTDSLPDDLDGLLTALHERDNAPGGLVAACAAGERVEPPLPLGKPTDHMPRGSASGAALVASMAPPGYVPHSGPIARARRKDRLQTLLDRDRPRGTGSSSGPRSSSITAAAAFADTPDGTVLTWTGIGREARRSRMDELLGAPS